MLINYDIEKINLTFKDFRNATGVTIGLLRPDFTPAYKGNLNTARYCQLIQSSEDGKKACLKSDSELLMKSRETKKIQMSICHAGLLNIVIPLLYSDIIIGYLIFGCIKASSHSPTEATPYDTGLSYDGDMKKYYSELPSLNSEKIQSISSIAEMLAKYILLENMLKPSFDPGIQKVIEYISNNITGDLSILAITKNANVSKSLLYRSFQNLFRCTVGEYIKLKRVEYSIEIMKTGDFSVEELSQKAGFTSASYYSRIFKKHIGVSPAKYKKQIRL